MNHSAGLDPINAEVVREIVLELVRAGTTILFSTHDMIVAEALCDQILMIYQGRKVLDGTLRQIQQEHGGDVLPVRIDWPEARLANSMTCPVLPRLRT